MHCQICNTFCSEDIAEYNETTGKMDFLCPACQDSHKETMTEFKPTLGELAEDVMWETELYPEDLEGEEDDYVEE